MGQFFGGERVSMFGVAGLAIGVPYRGKGAGGRLVTEAVRLARAQHYAISSLFPTTVALYHRAGWERAGHRLRTTVDLRRLRLEKNRLRVEEHSSPSDEAKALYREVAKTSPGYLDRGPYVWSRMASGRGVAKRTFTFHSDRGLEAYVVLAHLTNAAGDSYIEIFDAAAKDRVGGAAIWGLLSEYQSVANETIFFGGAEGFLHSILPERHYKIDWVDSWMTRICDPALALRSRGYPPVSAQVTFLLDDGSVTESSNAYSLSVSCGKPTVDTAPLDEAHNGARGVRITERGLASLYTGFLSPWELRRLQLLECSDEEAAVLSMLFGGRAPALQDHF
jgi:predicted acetyltransferase